MLPAMAFLILFLAYPLGLGVWLSFTDAKIGRAGQFIGSRTTTGCATTRIFWLSVFNTLLYTFVASVIKFAIGLYLALLLNEHMPFKAMLRAIVLIPFIVPTVLSALAFWWIFDSQFSIISWSLKHLGLISQNINFLGDANWARVCVIFANIWRGVPFVAITLLAGLQTVSPSLYEAATIDGATRWQMFRHITYPLLTPIIAVVMTFSVLFTFTDFQLIWAMTRGGPVNATHLMATLSYQRAIIAGQLGEGAAISTAMIPFLLAAIMVSWFGCSAASGSRERTMTDLPATKRRPQGVFSARRRRDDHTEGMSYLQSVPRRLVTLYLPLSIIVIVLLFPFYWMALTAIKPDEQLLDLDTYSPFWTSTPTFKHFYKLLFESHYPLWLWNTMYVAVGATVLSIIASVLAAYAIVRLRYRGASWSAA